MNSVVLAGRLTRDPELRELNDDKSVVNFSVAINDGRDKDKVDFIDVTAWNGTAKFVSKWFKQGDGIVLQGRLRQERWEQDGKNRTKVSVVANNVEFPQGKKSGTQNESRDTNKDQNQEQGEPVGAAVGSDDNVPF